MHKKDQKALFVRPNLKLFVLAALGLVVLQHLTGSGSGDTLLADQLHTSPPRDQDMEQLLDQSLREPSSANLNVLSEVYRLRGEPEKAMHYLRKAAILSDIEASE